MAAFHLSPRSPHGGKPMKATFLFVSVPLFSILFVTQSNGQAGTGALVLDYGTYLGGSSLDSANAVELNAIGEMYMAGDTLSDDFPCSSQLGGYDVFIAKFAGDGSLIYCVRLGGKGDDFAYGLSSDDFGNVYVTGSTASPDFPVTPSAFQTQLIGISNGFVLELDTAGKPIYVTYLGGSSADAGIAIANHGPRLVAVGGTANSRDFPVTAGAAQSISGGN